LREVGRKAVRGCLRAHGVAIVGIISWRFVVAQPERLIKFLKACIYRYNDLTLSAPIPCSAEQDSAADTRTSCLDVRRGEHPLQVDHRLSRYRCYSTSRSVAARPRSGLKYASSWRTKSYGQCTSSVEMVKLEAYPLEFPMMESEDCQQLDRHKAGITVVALTEIDRRCLVPSCTVTAAARHKIRC
jgi:hypothetical protein